MRIYFFKAEKNPNQKNPKNKTIKNQKSVFFFYFSKPNPTNNGNEFQFSLGPTRQVILSVSYMKNSKNPAIKSDFS